MSLTTAVNYRFAFNDFEFGGGNSVYQILSVEGLEDLPGIRNQDDNRGYQDGMFTGRDFLSGRTIIITMYVFGDQTNSMQYNLDLLQRNVQPQQQGTGILQFKLPNSLEVQRINARVRRRSLPINIDYSSGRATVIYEFFCPDPRYYDDTLQSTLLQISGLVGRTYNRTYNMVYGSQSIKSNAITNYGWTTTYPVITINGPATNPSITNYTTNQTLLLNVTLSVNDVLVLNTDFRTVTLNGVSRRALLDNASSWFAAAPGTSYYFWTASGTTGSSSVQVQWRSAYI